MPVQVHSSFFVHPGKWLMDETVRPSGAKIVMLAAHLQVTRQALSTLLNGRSGLSADMAIRFEKAFGVSADTLMRMQAAYDLADARGHEAKIKVTRIPAFA